MKENSLIPESAMAMFEQAENALDKKLQAYSKSAEDCLKLDDLNLAEKSLASASIHHGWINCLWLEKKNLSKLIKLKETKETEYLEKYGKPDIPRYKVADEMKKSGDIAKIEGAIVRQKDIINYLMEICSIMKSFGYSIKNCVEMAKLSH
jgi:hypothetical protein